MKGNATFGLQPVFVNLSREQVLQGNEVHVISSLHENEPVEEEDRGVLIHRVPHPYGISALLRMKGLVSGSSGWMVHSHATAGLFAGVLKHFTGFRMVAHVHGTSERRLRKNSLLVEPEPESFAEPTIRHFRERTTWSSADIVLSICNFVSEDLVNLYKIDREVIRTVYNGVDEKVFKPLPSPRPPPELEGKKIVLYVGHFGTRKGAIHAVRAMKSVKREVKDAHLLLVGGAPKWLGNADYWGQLEHEISANGLEGCVTLSSAVPNQDLVNLYSCSAVFTLPSYLDAFPKVILEAMSCAKAVVATTGGGVPEMVEHGKNGLLVDYGNSRQLAEALSILLCDERKADKMGRLGRTKVEQLFTWTKVAERVEGAYKDAETA